MRRRGLSRFVGAMSFVLFSAPAAQPASGDVVIVVQRDRLAARVGPAGAVEFPAWTEVASWPAAGGAPLHLGRLGERTCWLAATESPDAPAPDGWTWSETRALVGSFSTAQWHAVSCARELHAWRGRHRFCGCCGNPTEDSAGERAKRCPKCGAQFFPNPAPAVIVAVTRGDRILLAHNRNFRAGMFSTLAGFVDPGETAEQAVVREVHEEAGITVGALRYVSSQPWPFPNSLMLGFRAEHVAGEIAVDGQEIAEAGWFARDALPDIPRAGTVARALIDGWLREAR